MLTTEMTSKYDDLEKKSVLQILLDINTEDNTVPAAVRKAIPQIEKLVTAIVGRMKKGGRLIYVGAGTSGRLGVLDASECPPTFGIPGDRVIGIIAGGDIALRHSVENAEDEKITAVKDLKELRLTKEDCIIGIAASGVTPYVLAAIESTRKEGLLTGCIVCNQDTPLAAAAEYPVEVPVGPEFLTGSTRMKAGSAQKMILNMISTAAMIRLGRVKGNKMVDMKMSNKKLTERGIRIVMHELGVDIAEAKRLIQETGSVRNAIDSKTDRLHE